MAKEIFNFSPEQISIIFGIANQCPLAGGNAVYFARSLYALVMDTIYDDELLCNLAGFKDQPNQEIIPTKGQQFKIYPNPASQKVTIEWQFSSDEFANIKFINALGQVYYDDSFIMSGQEREINIKNWIPGVYQVCIKYSDVNVYCDKLIIIK